MTDVLASPEAAASWPFTAEDEADYLDQSFSDELCSAAAAIGLGLQESGWKEWVTG